MVETKKEPVVATGVKTSPFGDNSTDGLMVHATTKGVVVSPSQNNTKTIRHSINNSEG